MCLIVMAWRAHPEIPCLIAANRDEFHGRPTAAAHWWTDRSDILAGRDLLAGGTWIGITRSGRFAAVTNYRDPANGRADAPSRGSLVRSFLESSASVAEGLAKTAGVITGAAVIMVSVFAAFALADTITVKSIGVGLAIAVLVDTTIVRLLLVTATMRLPGKWNWWAPGFLARLGDRVGSSHVEDEATIPTDEPVPGARSEPPDRPAAHGA